MAAARSDEVVTAAHEDGRHASSALEWIGTAG